MYIFCFWLLWVCFLVPVQMFIWKDLSATLTSPQHCRVGRLTHCRATRLAYLVVIIWDGAVQVIPDPSRTQCFCLSACGMLRGSRKLLLPSKCFHLKIVWLLHVFLSVVALQISRSSYHGESVLTRFQFRHLVHCFFVLFIAQSESRSNCSVQTERHEQLYFCEFVMKL